MSVRLVALLVATVLLGCSSAPDGSPAPGTTDTSTSAASEASEQATDSPANKPLAADPRVKVKGDCAPEPLTDAAGLYVGADLRVRNTGNIGVEARIKVVWPLTGSQRLVKARVVRLRPDRAKSVDVRVALTQEDADALTQAVADGRACRVTSSVVGAFGTPVED